MATLHMYKYAMSEKNMSLGIQTLRGSHSIIPIEAVQVGHERQLLMDRHVVDDLNGCFRTVHQPRKHPANPLIKAETPWEAAGPNSYGTVMYDQRTKTFRLWTSATDSEMVRQLGKVPGSHRVLYYESKDGLNWNRPNLGLCEYEGSKDNNILMNRFLTNNLFVLPLPQGMGHLGKYAMLYNATLPPAEIPDPDKSHGMRNHLAFSEDGIVWKDAPENPIWCGRSDAANCVVYNDQREVFMLYRRAITNAGEIRRTAYSQSKDLRSWSQPVNIFGHDELDPLHLYTMHVSKYYGVYLGFLMRLHMHPDPENRELGSGKDFQMDTELTWSRNGIDWGRHALRPAFIDTGPPYTKAIDWGMVRGMANIMEMDDHIRIYYGASDGLHKPGFIPEGSVRHDYICLGTLRKDGFVSIDATTDGGYMLTRPLACPGGRLHINAKTGPDGFVKVAVREGMGVRDGEWLADWNFEKCQPFTDDSTEARIDWTGQTDMECFRGQTVRLHFWLENAQLFSFWFD